jgi:type I restriction enzyme R subunit
MPTALYSYEEAVRDGILCDFKEHVNEAQTHFQIQGIKPQDIPEEERQKLINLGIDPDDFRFEGTELEKKVAVKGTSEAIIREFMDNCLMDQSGQMPAKSIIFAISKDHAKRLWEAFERLYPEYRGRMAQIIVSEDSRVQDIIREFTNEDFPRIAISVDMLDTGIDVPEVCNLIFAKPVFSHIKFWQMIGRGTRSDSACHNREWLPEGHKEYFKVFDFWNNFAYWKMIPKKDEAEQTEAISSRIFLLRLKQLAIVRKKGDKKKEMEIRAEIEKDIRSLPMDSVSIKENEQKIERALSPKIWDNVALDPVLYLKSNIMPLMRFKPEVNLKESSFVIKCERLGLAVLENNHDESECLKSSISEMIERLPRTLDEVKQKEVVMDISLSHSFWEKVSYDDSKQLITELAPLMKYLSREVSKPIVIDMGDVIERRAKGEIDLKEPPYVTSFRFKVEDKIQRLIDESIAVKKIMKDEQLTEADLTELESSLSKIGIGITEESVQAHYPRETLVDLVKSVLGIGRVPDATKLVEEAFQTYMIENNKHYNADQLNFIRTLETVFLRKKKIEMTDLWDAPFSNFGINAPLPMFEESDLKDFIELCHSLGRNMFRMGV